VLSGPEWVQLCRVAGLVPPAGFGIAGELADQELAAATRTLTERGVLINAGTGVHPSVGTNLEVWAAPAALIHIELSVRSRGLRAVYAVRALLGGSLFTLADYAVELSLFPAVSLGQELVRAVPDAPERTVSYAKIKQALAGTEPLDPPVRGRLPLSVLAEYGRSNSVAAELTARTIGVLRCLAIEGTAAPHDADTVLVGEVVWLLTDTGWIGLHPSPDRSERQAVDLVPVSRDQLGSWLAPYLTQILEAADERA
jgi:hypothetical protein